MDGGSRDSNPQATSEDETKKRNTDCVYFLASPLTCIKGADCEYRHSENARINPRDCWFWLNGNCLNLKCAFRHPPLDGFRGISATASSGSSHVPFQPAMAAQVSHYASAPYHPTPYTSNRQKIPCYYFQKGNCLKGDKCPFMHGSQLAGDSTLPQTVKTAPVSDPQSIKKTVNGTENPTLQQKNPPQAFALHPVDPPPIVKADAKTGVLPSTLNTVQKNKAPINVDDEPIRSTQAGMLVSTGSALVRPRLRQSQPQDERFQNGKDIDECLGESSPGFDVLVDDDMEEEYFDADMERAPGHGGRHLDSQREFDCIGSGADILGEFDGEHGELGAYDVYGRKQDHFGWEQTRAPVDRILERPSMAERKLSREESPGQIDGQDLRHRLSKRRRVNERRVVASPNHHGDLYQRDDQLVEDWYHKHSHREQLQHPSTERTLSKRLHGRIKFPGRTSPDSSSEPYYDMEAEQRKMRGRSSPSTTGLHQGRYRDKARGRTNDDIAIEEKSFRGETVGNEERKPDSLDFAGPKSLAELKSAKVSETLEEQNSALANRQALKSQVVHGETKEKNMKLWKCSSQDSNASFSFEGPKPLSEILKKKRETSSGNSSDPKKENEENQMEKAHGDSDITALQTPLAQPPELKKEASGGGNHSSMIFGTDHDNLDSTGEVHPFRHDESPTEAVYNAQEDLLMLDSEDQVVENLERDRESEDAGIEENPDAEDEYEDDEDGDDFARKLGVMFS